MGYITILKVLVCLECHQCYRMTEILGHIRENHKELFCLLPRTRSLQQDAVQSDLNCLWLEDQLNVLDDDESVVIPPFPLPLMPFLMEPEYDEGKATGYWCRMPGCTYACPKKKTFANHMANLHKSRDLRPAMHFAKDGHVQRMFKVGKNSQYLRVHIALMDEPVGTDFDLWYAARIVPQIELDPTGLEDDSYSGDMSPFLQKVGWLKAINGCSIYRLKQLVSLPRYSSSLGCLQYVARLYLKSITDLDIAKVPGSILSKLVKWKGHQCVRFPSHLKKN